jgi:CubicO group peptidase (beta-lactamase class C family)/uncharacterized protein (DUF2141 family)
MRTRTKGILLIGGALTAVAVGYGVHRLRESTHVWSAILARSLCENVFVAGRDPSDVLATDWKGAALRVDVDRAAGAVTAGALGVKQRAIHRDGLGCTLVVGTTEDELRRATPPRPITPPLDAPDRAWPAGEAVSLRDLPASVDARRLDGALDRAFSGENADRTRAVVVVVGDRIVAERYAAGFSAATRLPGYSMSKTVTAALVGVLVGRGLLDVGKPAPIAAWHASGDPRAAITLDALLHMTSGLEWRENPFDTTSDGTVALHRGGDVAAHAIAKPLASAPATLWSYSTGTSSIVARVIDDTVQQAGEKPVFFPAHALFDRIGMRSAEFALDAAGTHAGGHGVHATARDWARFGMLLRDDGVWQRARILPAGWTAYLARPSPVAPFGAYGAHAWTNAGGWMPALPRDAFFARGFGEQWIAVVPSRDAVIVRLGWNPSIMTWDEERFVADVLAALSPAPLPTVDGTILFHARDLRGDAGHVLCFLQPSAASWPDGLLRWARGDVRGGEATCAFAGVAPGTYAISAFHDENADGMLQRTLGIWPREGVGSSATTATGGTPTFADASFAYDGGVREVEGRFRYSRLRWPR